MAYKTGTNGNDWLSGTSDNDALLGYDGTDFLFGNGGEDVLHGGAGNDWLYGGAGNDYLWGQQGNDYIEGGAGADQIWGGMGNEFGHSDNDTAGYLLSPTGVFVSLGAYGIKGAWLGDAEGDQLYNIENLWGSKFNDALWGDDSSNGLKGYEGNDILRGWAGDDTIEGGDGHYQLYGDYGIDTLNGGSGNDWLWGGGGGDTMSGGSGADTFVWWYTTESDGTSWNTDFITDFNRAEGDLLNLSAIDANANGTWDVSAAGNQAFSFIGTADHPFTAPGQISFAHAAGTNGSYSTHILLNTDDDAEAEGLIDVSGMHAVDSGWFML
jgi:Ca2+-binding RTX toxin-like protein